MHEARDCHFSSKGADSKRFDVVNETLVKQAMLIEASAGTGKTYSLERLVARLIIEKAIPVKSLLIMTFSRAATAELSARIRKILMKYRDGLRKTSATETEKKRFETGDYDEIDKMLLEKWSQLPEKEHSKCIEHLSEAMNHFDDAAIFTIHSFCQRMLADYVFSRGGSFEMTLGNDDVQVAQALDEALRSTYASQKEKRVFIQELQRWKEWDKKLAKLKSQSMEDVDLDVFSTEAEKPISNDMKDWIQETFKAVPDRIRALKRTSKTLVFDDLLLEFWLALKDEKNRPLVDNIRQRFKAVFVDEFQDTDPIQFNILKKLFLDDTSASSEIGKPYVFFVGDPKQAIYGFRSAELETYLQAKQGINHIRMLDTNFRSTPALVHAVNTFFSQKDGQSRFLNDAIQYETVGVNPKKLPLMRKTEENAWLPVPAFELWTNTFDEDAKFTGKEINQWLAKAIATDIVSLLDGTVYYRGKPLEAKDIAILVKRRASADAVIMELAVRGIRTRLNGNESVFQSTEAIEILAVLNAMVAPERLDVLTAARATRLVGHSLKVIQEDEFGLQVFRNFVRTASQRVMKEGIYPVFVELMHQYDTDKRLLPLLKGARMLTNYHHVLELMQVAQQAYGDLMGITHWLRKNITDGLHLQTSDEDASKLRVESDDNLVNIVTIHASKGLEYSVVYLCDAVATRINIHQKSSIFREDRHGQKCYVLADEPIPVSKHLQTREREEQELIRLAYVAMTRASARVVLPLVLGVEPRAKSFSKFSKDSIASAYIRTMYAQPMVYDKKAKKDPSDEERSRKWLDMAVRAWWECMERAEDSSVHQEIPKIQTIIKTFKESFAKDRDYQANGHQGTHLTDRELGFDDFYRWRHVSSQDDNREIPVNEKPLTQQINQYQADIGHGMPKTWGRTSFSGINRKLSADRTSAYKHSGYTAFPKGVIAGDFLHKLIEKAINQRITASKISTDELQAFIVSQMKGKTFFATKNTERYQKACLERLGYRNHEEPASFSEYCAKWIENCLRILLTRPMTVEGAQIDLGALIRDRQVIPEIDFMLKAQGKAGQVLDIENLVNGLDDLSLKADPSMAKDSIKGYLTGQIDLLLKNTDGKYWVIDWKSNAIETETASCDYPGNYTQDAMGLVMDEHHYRLQVLCYTVALLRYLQQRHPKRSPEEVMDMIGGAVYVFLRGVDASGNSGIYSMPMETIRRQVENLNSILLD